MVDEAAAQRAGAEQALAKARQHLQAGGRAWLFLDYDGTLVPIAPTPDEAQPDADLLALLADLGRSSSLRVVILSGRPLSSLQAMLPVPGLILAGTYGVELQIAGARDEPPGGLDEVRRVVQQVKADWTEIVGPRPGFLIEDKGLAVALHARWAAPADADEVLSQARAAARQREATASLPLRVLEGDRFLEIAPREAHKGRAVERLLERWPWEGALVIYFGDDDKDEEAYAVVRRRGGLPMAVGPRLHRAGAVGWLPSPQAVRAALRSLLDTRVASCCF